MRHLLCLLSIHKLNQECVCTWCGKTMHAYEYSEEWENEEGIDPGMAHITDAWDASYTERKFELAKCARCGHTTRARTEWVRR